jgi:formamidopyrimidine-DNA glycosylase
MPELPEVETTVRGLFPVLQDARLRLVEPRRAGLRRVFPADLRQRLTGATVTRLARRAKYGLVETDRGDAMIFHLGMSGRWRIDPGELLAHDHLLLETDAGRRLALHDPRRFGSVDLWPAADLAAFPPFRLLGPEPLGPDFTGQVLRHAFAGRRAPVKAMLLDQRVVAGLGNIYVCEALHLSGIAPTCAVGAIAPAQADALAAAIRAVLEAAIAAGGSTLRDYARPDGELGYFSRQWRVYGREGEGCPVCAAPVRRRAEGGRSTFWCETCQLAPSGG